MSAEWWNQLCTGKSEEADVLFRSFLDTGGTLGAAKRIVLIGQERRAEGRWAQGGGPPNDDRLMFSAMLYVLRTNVPWQDLPACYGPWQSAYNRFRRWSSCGLFGRMLVLVANAATGKLRHLDCSHNPDAPDSP